MSSKSQLFRLFSILIILLFLPISIFSQVKITDDPLGNTTPDPSAILELQSFNKGFLPPSYSNATRLNVIPKQGLVIFNTDDQCLNIYQNGTWKTYCNFRFNANCNCIEYLSDYGLATQAWVQVPSSTDADWILDGSTSTPSNNTDDIHTLGRVTIGDVSAPELANINLISLTSSSNLKGVYNLFQNINGSDKSAMHNEFGLNVGGALDGVYNQFSSSSNSFKYGIRNLFESTMSGKAYGMANDFESASYATKFGMVNNFGINANGSKYGMYNFFPTSTTSGTIFGVYNEISNDGPSSKFGLYNYVVGLGDGPGYGSYNRVTMDASNTNNAYGTYNYVTMDGTGKAYAGYFRTQGAGNFGLWAQNTSDGGLAAALNGDVEIGDGRLIVGDAYIGNNTDGNYITRYGTWEKSFQTNLAYNDNGLHFHNLGVVDLPSDLDFVTVNKIEWDIDGHHEDRSELHGFAIGLQDPGYYGSAFYGKTSTPNTGAGDVNWQYETEAISQMIPNNQNIRIRTQDSNCFTCGQDSMRVYNVRLKLYYSYAREIGEGEIVASGLIYSNTSSQVGDLAEHFELNDQHGIEYGMVVGFKPGSDNEYELIAKEYSPHIVGVISENPSMVLNDPSVGPAVALAGRVKVKLIDSAKLIQSGDFLTTSVISGRAQKAFRSGKVIGYAVTNQKEGEDFVDILIQPYYHVVE